MARVGVEQKALTDPRFDLLGRAFGTTRFDALGRMLLVWNECQERGSYHLPTSVVSALLAHDSGAELLVKCGLAEPKRSKKSDAEPHLRIKGTEGRIEWLAVKRERAKENGAKGGRPRRLQAETQPEPKKNQAGFPQETPLTPALTPAPAQKTAEELPSEVPAAKPAKVRAPREPNPLFDAVAEITGADPKASGRFIGVVQAALAKAEPPYTPDDVREFGRQFAVLCPWSEGRRPTPGEVEKYIGLLRSGQGQPQRPQSRGFETPQDRIRANLIDVCEDDDQ